MENKRILVIGGTGYIGKAVLRKLSLENINIKCFSRTLVEGGIKLSWIKGDVLNFNQLLEATKNIGLVIYLVALKKGSFKDCFKTNVIGLENTIKAMKVNKVKRIIYFSTKNVLLKKRDSYAESKLIAEKVLLKSNLESVILRPDLVYGLDKENILSKLVSFSLRAGFLIIPGFKEKYFYPVNKELVAETCLGFVKHFKQGMYSISGEKTSLTQIIKLSSYLSKKKIKIIKFPLFLFEPFEFILPFSLSIFRENRSNSGKDLFSRTLKADIKKILILLAQK
ncbi:MAG: NAD-dependent epimerase/dehydratase family protein [Candidatus Pacearchaeota archaeon]|nr:NAD-dependent epimerase/dehydratase family protein [Candidatus Pacearchaeota archaeon]